MFTTKDCDVATIMLYTWKAALPVCRDAPVHRKSKHLINSIATFHVQGGRNFGREIENY